MARYVDMSLSRVRLLVGGLVICSCVMIFGHMPDSVSQVKVEGDYVVGQNGNGNWLSMTNATKDVVVVLGGENLEMKDMLLQEGYTVWWRTRPCPNRNLRAVRESWGYFLYLADTDPLKPVKNYTVFLHGHENETFHQRGDPIKLIEDAVDCARETKRYTSLNHAQLTTYWEQTGTVYMKIWNAHFSDWRPVTAPALIHYCCAQFVLPLELMNRVPMYIYQRALDMNENLLAADSFFWEQLYHHMFFEPQIINAYEHQCKPKYYPGKEVIKQPSSESLMGFWGPPADVDKQDILIVIGMEYAWEINAVPYLQELGYRVYMRTPQACGDRLGPGCREATGYFSYLVDPDKPIADYVAFMKGYRGQNDFEYALFDKELQFAIKCVKESKRFTPIGTHFDIKLAHQRLQEIMKFPVQSAWNRQFSNVSNDRLTIKDLPAPYFGGQFIVPKELILNTDPRIWHRAYEVSTVASWAELESPSFEYFYHVIFGAGTTMPMVQEGQCNSAKLPEDIHDFGWEPPEIPAVAEVFPVIWRYNSSDKQAMALIPIVLLFGFLFCYYRKR